MSVPEAVKRQEEEAQKMYEEAYQANTEEEEPVEATPDDQPEEPSEAESAEESTEEVAESTEDEVNFEQEYYRLKAANEVLAGKYDAEVPRLYQEIQSLKDQVARVPQRLDDEEGDPFETGTSDGDPISRLTEDYGEGFVNDLRTLFKAEFDTSVGPVAQRLQATEAFAMKTHKDNYFSRLGELVPDWRDIVQDARFVDFCKEVDEYSGVPRYALMQSAEGNLDADRMARFYDAYKKRIGKKPSGSQNKKLAALTPGQTSKSPSTGGANEPQYVSAQEIEKFSTDVALRKYVGREEEQRAMEEKINRAIANRWVI